MVKERREGKDCRTANARIYKTGITCQTCVNTAVNILDCK